MQKTTSASNTADHPSRRADARPQAQQQRAADRKGAAPQPLDLKTLEQVAGGLAPALPKRGW